MEQIGPYRVLEEVARGGMGIVHRAAAPDGRQVALKVLLAGRSASATQRKRFLLEVRALEKLDHPHVVRLLEAGEAYGCPWLALQWVEGGSLADRVARAGPLSPLEAVGLVRKLAGALVHCHARGVLHRDLSPKNVLIRAADGQPLLTDFGLSREVMASLSQSRPTVEGQLMGTPGFWAPEQALGELDRVGPATDVWGLGAVLYFCLTGAGPIAGTSIGDLALALHREVPPPSSLRPGTPRALDDVCLACLQKEPAARPASPAELELLLTRCLTTLALAPARGRAGPAAAAALVSLTLVLVGWIALAPRSSPLPTAAIPPEIEPAASSSGPPASSAPTELDALRARFAEAMGRQDWDAALAAIDAIVRHDGPRPANLADRGQIRLLRGEAQAALLDLEWAIATTDTPDPGWIASRGGAREMLGDLAGALADHERAAALDPGGAHHHYNRGVILARLGRVDEALAAYDRTLELAPDDAAARGNREELLRRR